MSCSRIGMGVLLTGLGVVAVLVGRAYAGEGSFCVGGAQGVSCTSGESSNNNHCPQQNLGNGCGNHNTILCDGSGGEDRTVTYCAPNSDGNQNCTGSDLNCGNQVETKCEASGSVCAPDGDAPKVQVVDGNDDPVACVVHQCTY